MRKKLILLTCILILSISFSSLAYADTYNSNEVGDLSSKEDLIIAPLWTYILDVWQTFDISSSGKAEIVATMDAKNTKSDSLKIVANLQQFKNGSWTTIKSWTSTTESTSLIFQKSWYVPKGYSYRVLTNYYAYSGTDIESTSIASKVVVY